MNANNAVAQPSLAKELCNFYMDEDPMKKIRYIILALVLLVPALLFAGCTPKPVTLEAVYYSDIKGDGSVFAFLQFYPDGVVSSVTVGPDQANMDPRDVYDQIATSWLTENPPSPAEAGAYYIQDGKVEIFFPASADSPTWIGTYTPEKITLMDENGVTRENILLP
jgi:hypothetical protein